MEKPILEKEPPPQYDSTPQVVYQQPKRWGEISERIVCVNCQQEVVTRVETKIGVGSWVAVGIVAWVLLAFGLLPCVPFALFALLLGFAKDKKHVCPNCEFVNGEKKAFH